MYQNISFIFFVLSAHSFLCFCLSLFSACLICLFSCSLIHLGLYFYLYKLLLCTNLAPSNINMQDWGHVKQSFICLLHLFLDVRRVNGDRVSQHAPHSTFVSYSDFQKIFMLPSGPLTSFPVCGSKSMIIWPCKLVSHFYLKSSI